MQITSSNHAVAAIVSTTAEYNYVTRIFLPEAQGYLSGTATRNLH
jgi:hypothetical protein